MSSVGLYDDLIEAFAELPDRCCCCGLRAEPDPAPCGHRFCYICRGRGHADKHERILSVDDDGIVVETPWWVNAEWEDDDT